MRTFELRVYKLRTEEALDFYREQIYPRHLNSFPLFGGDPELGHLTVISSITYHV